MAKLRVGVMGMSGIGRAHWLAWAGTEGVEVVAGADIAPDTHARFQEECPGAATFGDYHELLDGSDADIVSICLPTPLHHDAAVACLRAGRHVLCEKPPTNNAAEAQALADLAAATRLRLGFSLQRRFTAEVREARRLVTSGAIGDAFYARCGWVRTLPHQSLARTGWRLIRGAGGGSLLDIGVHLFDETWFTMGCPKPISVTGYTAHRFIPVLAANESERYPADPADDLCAALVRCENGTAILLESAYGLWRANSPVEYLDITGTKGGIQLHPQWLVADGKTGEESPLLPHPEKSDCGHAHEMELFADAVRNGAGECGAPPEDAVQLMKIIDGILASADSGSSVSLD